MTVLAKRQSVRFGVAWGSRAEGRDLDLLLVYRGAAKVPENTRIRGLDLLETSERQLRKALRRRDVLYVEPIRTGVLVAGSEEALARARSILDAPLDAEALVYLEDRARADAHFALEAHARGDARTTLIGLSFSLAYAQSVVEIRRDESWIPTLEALALHSSSIRKLRSLLSKASWTDGAFRAAASSAVDELRSIIPDAAPADAFHSDGSYKSLVRRVRDAHFLNSSIDSAEPLKMWIAALESAFGSATAGASPRALGPRLDPKQLELSTMPVTDPKELCARISPFFARVQKAGNPMMAKNVNPACCVPAVAAGALADLLVPNSCTEEMAGNLALAEVVVARAVSSLIGLPPDETAGLMTYGGTSTIGYALRIGVLKADPGALQSGLRVQPVLRIIAGQAAHEALHTNAMWHGLGREAVRLAAAHPDMSTDLGALERLARAELEAGHRIALLQAACGTTSNFAIDDLAHVASIRDALVRDYRLPYRIHLHVDSVAGWIAALFRDYDLAENHLAFPPAVRAQLARYQHLLGGLSRCDSFGIDFHKTGFTTYPSSMALVRRREDLELLRGSKENIPHLYAPDTVYHPGHYTLETSRSGADALAPWVTLTALGLDGLRALWGNALAVGHAIAAALVATPGFAVANENRFGADVLFRAYPPTLHAPSAAAAERRDLVLRDRVNAYNEQFASWVGANMEDRPDGVAVSHSRSVTFDSEHRPISGIRVYLVTPHATEENARRLVRRIADAKRLFDAQVSHERVDAR